ncbi:MAG: DUF2064 domain-containing protein [Gammaproteobacteria bacterium]|nr:DUF2064 domain-containing protein [Gammaproteobacteria bacterium]
MAATIGAKQALVFAEHFLQCALEDLNTWSGNVVISPASIDDQAWAQQLLTKDLLVLPQQTGNLGQRLNTLDQQLRDLGHSHILYIGSDAPALTITNFNQITDALLQDDIALAPALDGGVTIMANRVPWPDLEHLPWSTDQLGDALAALCDINQQTVTITDITYDIDHQQQLSQLGLDLLCDNRPARQMLLNQIQLFAASVAAINESPNDA